MNEEEIKSRDNLLGKLLDIIKDLRAENNVLQEIIFRQQGLLEEKVIVPPAPGQHIGKEPWYLKKQKLERSFRVLPEKKEEENAG